jgi:hypothetical protein
MNIPAALAATVSSPALEEDARIALINIIKGSDDRAALALRFIADLVSGQSSDAIKGADLRAQIRDIADELAPVAPVALTPRSPSKVKSSRRVCPGVYRVELENGVEATVSRDNAIDGDTGVGKWGWSDGSGGTSGHDTKKEAIWHLRDYRG